MSDEDAFLEDIVEDQHARGTHHRGSRRGGRRSGGLRALIPILLVAVVLGGLAFGGYQGYRWLTSNVNVEAEEQDYPGPGTGEVVIEVAQGDTGTDIASTLVEEGVIESAGPFVTVLSNTPEASSI